MFHNHTTQWRICIIANKSRLNKLLQSITYLSRVKPRPPATCDCRQHAPKLLEMLLAALVPTKSQAVEAAKRCQTHAHADHETARISFQPTDTIFQLSWQETEQWGVTHCSLCIVEGIRHLRDGHEVASFCCVKHGGYDLDRVPFERCILETEWMETRGNSLRCWDRKCIKWVKNCSVARFLTS
jgi:hypothetical protein